MMTSDDVPIDVCATGENLLDEKIIVNMNRFFKFHARKVTRKYVLMKGVIETSHLNDALSAVKIDSSSTPSFPSFAHTTLL
jgi:hypothetical protein